MSSLTVSASAVLDGRHLGDGHCDNGQAAAAAATAGGDAGKCGGAACRHHNLLHWCYHQQLPCGPHNMEFGRWLRRDKTGVTQVPVASPIYSVLNGME